MTEETPELRLRRLRMRSWRRGMKEMDLILGCFADRNLPDLPDPLLRKYEDLLLENDQDLYLWVTARLAPVADGRRGPAGFSDILDRIAASAATRPR